MKQIIKIITLCLVIIVTGCGNDREEIALSTMEPSEMGQLSEEQGIGELVEEESGLVEDIEEALISVYICGAVKAPGVYEFSLGDRFSQAIDRAEGFTEEAHGEYLNLAQLLTDGEMIYVPTKEEVQSGYMAASSGSDSGVDSNGKININTASKEQLMTLTGVGEAKALSIISYRDTNGNFSAIEDVMKISGIKDAVFNTIKDYITV